MPRILFVGDNPNMQKGNGRMMRSILEQLDPAYEAVCFAMGETLSPEMLKPSCYALVNAKDGDDILGRNKLLRLLNSFPFDAMVMVGIDIWTYQSIFDHIKEAQRRKPFRWAAIFPYDLIDIRKDWLKWINMVDVPCVYSMDGYERLKPHVGAIQYFRPALCDADQFTMFDAQRRAMVRERYFGAMKDRYIFGFIGENQYRKDPQKLIKAFAKIKLHHPNALLYLHTDLKGGAHSIYNLQQYAKDQGLCQGDLMSKEPGTRLPVNRMVELYNSFDCLVNCSLQEGLSWTIVEALLCGTPVILSDTTAHKDFIKLPGNVVEWVPCNEDAYMPVATADGQSWVDAKACTVDDLALAMDLMIMDPAAADMGAPARCYAGQAWVAGCHSINDLLHHTLNVCVPDVRGDAKTKRQAILFAQHSSAGDILMTTKALGGLRARHPGVPLIYMTQRKYWDILIGNPQVDEIVEWDEDAMNAYQFVYAPHRDRILPGHWGRNSNSLLSDFYWKILDVPRGDFFIESVRPHNDIVAEIEQGLAAYASGMCVVHTTGGDPEFRTYKYMADVCQMVPHFTVQLGGADDYPASACLDLRGKLSFRETAWVMQRAACAVTVDSFISHLAGALGIRQVCLFGSGNANVVAPEQVTETLSKLEPDYIKDCPGLGPCSASVRDCPLPCTSIHCPMTIAAQLPGFVRLKDTMASCDPMRTMVIAANMLNERPQLEGWFRSFAPLANAGILIVDGGSTDGTVEFCRRQPNTVVVVNDIIQQEGYGAARNHLCAMARAHFPDAHWLAFFDADERIVPADYHRFRFIRDCLRIEYDVVAFPRIDWVDDTMNKAAKDWHVYPDYQARMIRLGSPAEYYRKIHEQLRGYNKIYASMRNPKINHFHRTAGQAKRDYVGKVCAKLHAEDKQHGHEVPEHHKEAMYRQMLATEGL